MHFIVSIQLLSFLMVYAPSAHAIMVKFGTKGGPIVPPTPEPALPVPQPYRNPAPVWEERFNDSPDPNAHWRPQLFIPQPRFTQVVYNPPAQPLSNVQRFVNSYLPNQQNLHRPIKVNEPKNYFTPSQILGTQSLPGIGLRYFVPTFENDPRRNAYRQEDALQNDIFNNNVNEPHKESPVDTQWKHEKDVAKRTQRTTDEGYGYQVYQWPAYVPSRHL